MLLIKKCDNLIQIDSENDSKKEIIEEKFSKIKIKSNQIANQSDDILDEEEIKNCNKM